MEPGAMPDNEAKPSGAASVSPCAEFAASLEACLCTAAVRAGVIAGGVLATLAAAIGQLLRH
jgi:hypothetical protein